MQHKSIKSRFFPQPETKTTLIPFSCPLKHFHFLSLEKEEENEEREKGNEEREKKKKKKMKREKKEMKREREEEEEENEEREEKKGILFMC